MITEDMLHTVLQRRARGESIADIHRQAQGPQPEPSQHLPSLAEHAKRDVYPDAVAQAEAFAELQART